MTEIQKEGNLLQRQNLVSRTQGIRVVRPGALYKSIALNVITVLGAFAFSYTYRGYLNGTYSITIPFLTLTFFCACSALCAILIKSFGERSVTLIFEAIGCIAFFYDQPMNILMPVALLLIIFFFWGEITSRQEVKELMHLRFYRVAKLQLKKVVTGIVIMVVILWVPQWETKDSFIPQDTFRAFFDLSGGVTKNFYPDLNFTGTFHDLIDSFIRSQLKADEAFNKLNEAAQQTLINQKTEQVVSDINTKSGTSIQPQDEANQAFYELLIATIKQWRNMYGIWFVILWGVGIFFAIQSVGIFFQLVAILVAFIFYQLLIAFNVAHITGETRTKETIEFS